METKTDLREFEELVKKIDGTQIKMNLLEERTNKKLNDINEQLKTIFSKISGQSKKKLYHIGRELTFSPEGFYISNWSIFRKDMPSTEYFSENNTAILSSAKGNTIEDIKEFIKKEN